MEREREDVVASCCKTGGAVALVDIKINNQNTAGVPFRDQAVGNDSKIIEDAITSTRVIERMMASCSAIASITIPTRQLCCQPSSAIGMGHTLRDMRSYGKADPPLLFARDSGSEYLIDVIRAVDRLQPAARHCGRSVFGDGIAALAKGRHDSHILVEAERPARGCGGHVIDVVDDVKQGLASRSCPAWPRLLFRPARQRLFHRPARVFRPCDRSGGCRLRRTRPVPTAW